MSRSPQNGKYVYVTAQYELVAKAGAPQQSTVASVYALRVGSGCTLTPGSSLSPKIWFYTAIALLGNTGLVAVNTLANQIDTYRITNGTQFTLLSSTPSQAPSPGSVAVGRRGGQTYVFTSLGTIYQPGTEEAYTVNRQGMLSVVPGSPATDPGSQGSDYVLFDQVHQQVLQSEVLTNTLSIFGAKGEQFAFLSHTTLAVGGGPGPMAALGSLLFVDSSNTNICLLGFGSVTCVSSAVPENAGAGISIL
jgi:hypothetical protein